MRIGTTLVTAASIAVLSTFAFAGGLSDEIMEAPVEVMDEMAPATSSVKPIYLILGILAAVAIGAAVASNEDDDDDDDTSSE